MSCSVVVTVLCTHPPSPAGLSSSRLFQTHCLFRACIHAAERGWKKTSTTNLKGALNAAWESSSTALDLGDRFKSSITSNLPCHSAHPQPQATPPMRLFSSFHSPHVLCSLQHLPSPSFAQMHHPRSYPKPINPCGHQSPSDLTCSRTQLLPQIFTPISGQISVVGATLKEKTQKNLLIPFPHSLILCLLHTLHSFLPYIYSIRTFP